MICPWLKDQKLDFVASYYHYLILFYFIRRGRVGGEDCENKFDKFISKSITSYSHLINITAMHLYKEECLQCCRTLIQFLWMQESRQILGNCLEHPQYFLYPQNHKDSMQTETQQGLCKFKSRVLLDVRRQSKPLLHLKGCL